MPERVLYLQPARRLGRRSRPTSGDSATFVYNPADPTPTLGGRLLSPVGGYRDDTALARRADVLTFTSEPLPSDLYVVGTPEVELAHSCHNPHNDLFVRVSQVDAHGGSRNVSDGYLAAAPDSGTVKLELDAVRARLPGRVADPAARRGRVPSSVSCATSAPGNRPSAAPSSPTARHTVHLGADSRLVLPAGQRPPSAD